MRIAITGGSGRVGTAVIAEARRQGHAIVSIDRAAAPPDGHDDGVTSVAADILDYERLLRAIRGCDALIHLAAIPSGNRTPENVTHANNVVGSYNAMRAAIEAGITRICQASSVNAIGLSFSRRGRFDYFPIDEAHPNHNEEVYGLSKWICEQQADSLARRYEAAGIASLRFHYVAAERADGVAKYGTVSADHAKHLWGYTLARPAAQACLLALEGAFTGHEVFYIVAPDTTVDVPSRELAARFFPDVPIRGDLGGRRSFFSSEKAVRLLGWTHPAGD